MLKKEIKPIIQKLLLGFAAGVMIAASVWSLLIPAIEMAETQGKPAWLPASVGFMIGIVTLIGVNNLAEKIEKRNNKKNECVICDDIENLLDAEENDEKIVIKNKEKLTIKEKVKSTTMLMLAVTLHNIPEGMAVGVAFAGLFSQNTGITLAEAFALAIGIAIQNIPEGAIISMPLKAEGMSKGKAFLYGVLSGVVEPIGAVLTVVASGFIIPVLPYFLSFAAGAMMYVVIEELIPEMSHGNHSNIGTVMFAVGFTLMMILDVALG